MGGLGVMAAVLDTSETTLALGPILATRQHTLGPHCLPPGYLFIQIFTVRGFSLETDKSYPYTRHLLTFFYLKITKCT